MQTPSLSQAVDGGELLSQLEKRRQRLARRLKQAAFGVYLKKSAHQLPASVNSGDEMNLGDQLYSRAFQLAARDKHVEASRLRELTAQLENSHLTTSDGGDVSAVLRFLILLTDSKNMSAVSRSSNGLVEIGSSVPMHNGSNQQPATSNQQPAAPALLEQLAIREDLHHRVPAFQAVDPLSLGIPEGRHPGPGDTLVRLGAGIRAAVRPSRLEGDHLLAALLVTLDPVGHHLRK